MKPMPYQRKQGDFELRILHDGRLVLVAPDETLMEMAQAFEPNTDAEEQHVESKNAEAEGPGSQ